MNQLSLFESMNQPLLTTTELEERVLFMKNETITPSMHERWDSLQANKKFRDAYALAKEFVVEK